MTITPRQAREALEEISFDHATGRLSAADYEALRRQYARVLDVAAAGAEAPAAAPLCTASGTVAPSQPAPRSGEGELRAAALDRAAEALVQRMRESTHACSECGPRPEPDARHCSHCGRWLGVCPACGAAVVATDARFCAACGATLPA